MSSIKLVHFCHGATGGCFVYAKAAVLFQSEAYLAAATMVAECVWHYGILKIGPGLCHGLSGSVYAMLTMYRLTSAPMWLERACCLASVMVSPLRSRAAMAEAKAEAAGGERTGERLPGGQRIGDAAAFDLPDVLCGARTPNRPHSLFEGLAGPFVSQLICLTTRAERRSHSSNSKFLSFM
jgi:hypothetical protein